MKLEDIVGEFDPAVGLTSDQQRKLGSYMMERNLDTMKESLGDAMGDYLFPSLVTKHWALSGPTDPLRNAVVTWSASALQMLLLHEERERYADYRQKNPLPGFAGDRLPDHSFPCANIWYEAAYPAGRFPTLVPRGDNLPNPLIKIRRFAALCVHRFCTNPFPDEISDSADFLKHASLICFIEDALGTIHTYAGSTSYLPDGGAMLWRVETLDQLHGALQNQLPVSGISHLAQFCCGEVAHLLQFYGNMKYQDFKAQYAASGEPNDAA